MSVLDRVHGVDIAFLAFTAIIGVSCVSCEVAQSCETDAAACRRACEPQGVEFVSVLACRCRGER